MEGRGVGYERKLLNRLGAEVILILRIQRCDGAWSVGIGQTTTRVKISFGFRVSETVVFLFFDTLESGVVFEDVECRV